MAKNLNPVTRNQFNIWQKFISGEKYLLSVKDVLIIQVITFWNVWYWYVFRITDKSDEPLGLIALFTVVFFIGKIDLNKQIKNTQLNIIMIMLLAYVVTYSYTSTMIHAIFGVFTVGYTIYTAKERISPAIFGLFFLALPILASMQFYLGYPLRMISGFFTINLLRMNGFYVIQEGTCLKFGRSLVCIDAPCSGVNMLWMSFYFSFFICCLYKLNLRKTIIVSLISFVSILIANIIRSTALFYMESGIFKMPDFAHQGIGITTFLISISLVFIYVNISEKKCEV